MATSVFKLVRKFGIWSAKAFADSVSVEGAVRTVYLAGMGAILAPVRGGRDGPSDAATRPLVHSRA